jgi:hypothetical protein
LNPPLTCTVKYEAGIDCRREDVGVIGDRKDKITSTGNCEELGAGMLYVRLVVEASKVEPKYSGYETLNL